MTAQKPEALRLADKYEEEGFLQDHRFAQNEWCRQAAVELRRLHAANVECMEWNEAARQDILSLRAQVQELEAQLASIGAGGTGGGLGGCMGYGCARRILHLTAEITGAQASG